MQGSELFDRLSAALGATAHPPTEGIVAGTADIRVTGIATCAMPSIEVLRKSAAAGCNFVLADGHPFFAYEPIAAQVAQVASKSPVGLAKAALIESAGMVVVRLTSAWDAARPADGSLALAGALGLKATAGANGGDFAVAPVRRSTLKTLAGRIAASCGLQGIRLDGRSDLIVSRVAVGNGMLSPQRLRRMLADPRVDAIIGGEVVEWEGGPYFHDAVTEGRRSGLILTGFASSQQPLAAMLAAWVRKQVHALPVKPITQTDPIRIVKPEAAR